MEDDSLTARLVEACRKDDLLEVSDCLQEGADFVVEDLSLDPPRSAAWVICAGENLSLLPLVVADAVRRDWVRHLVSLLLAHGWVEGVEYLANEIPKPLKEYSPAGLLALSVGRSSCRMTEALLDCGLDIHEVTFGKTPIQHACSRVSYRQFQLFRSRGARLSEVDEDGGSLLHLLLEHRSNPASAQARRMILLELIESGLDVNCQDNDRITPLHQAIRSRHHEEAGILLEHGADIEARCDYENTPLLLACRSMNAEGIRLLLEAGADPHARDEGGEGAITKCLTREMLLPFLDAGIDINEQDGTGDTVLHTAAFCGKAEFAHFILERGGRREIRNSMGQTPSDVALAEGYPSLARFLRLSE